MGFNGLTVSIVAVVVHLVALLRLVVYIRLLHPGQKNPPPLPPMVKQNVGDDMGEEHTTERTEFTQFMQANSRSTNSSSVANQQLYNVEPQEELTARDNSSFRASFRHRFLITTWVPFLERSGPLRGRYSYFRNRA